MKKVLLIFIIPICISVSCRNRECPAPDTPVSKTTSATTPVVTSTSPVNMSRILTLQPGAEGKDAMIWHINTTTTTFGNVDEKNTGMDPEFPMMNWTFEGAPGIYNSLIEFDLSAVSSTATILSAKLSLYACRDCGNAGHEARDGKTNPGLIRRIIEPWDENTVTWNTKPAVTSVNEVVLHPSDSAFEDYIDIDVTALVQDMLNNPTAGFGFYCSITDTDYYKKLIFAAGDHADASKHPKLVVQYQ